MLPDLADIQFLADSQHRPVVLEALTEGPQSRMALREATGASSATIGRIVQAFEQRGWLVRQNPEYSLTPLGEFVAASFEDFRAEMAFARDMGRLLPRVPLDDIGITVADLTDALVTRRTQANPFAVVSRIRELELDSRTARSLTDFFPEPCIDGRYGSIVHGDQVFEAVFAPIVIEAAMASPSADKFEAIVASDRTDIYVHDREIAHPVMVHDGVACLVVRDEDDVSIGLIETDDERVLEWVTDAFETARSDAALLTPGDLSAPVEDLIAEA